jgi:hypothetical protein
MGSLADELRGQGFFTRLLGALEEALLRNDLGVCSTLMVQSVTNKRLAAFMRRRASWEELAGDDENTFVFLKLRRGG